MEVSTAEVTVSAAPLETLPDVAVIVAMPVPRPVATPDALTLATPGTLDVHVTEEVMSDVLPSENIPYAVNACDCPFAIEAVPGETRMLLSCAAVTLAEELPMVEPR